MSTKLDEFAFPLTHLTSSDVDMNKRNTQKELFIKF